MHVCEPAPSPRPAEQARPPAGRREAPASRSLRWWLCGCLSASPLRPNPFRLAESTSSRLTRALRDAGRRTVARTLHVVCSGGDDFHGQSSFLPPTASPARLSILAGLLSSSESNVQRLVCSRRSRSSQSSVAVAHSASGRPWHPERSGTFPFPAPYSPSAALPLAADAARAQAVDRPSAAARRRHAGAAPPGARLGRHRSRRRPEPRSAVPGAHSRAATAPPPAARQPDCVRRARREATQGLPPRPMPRIRRRRTRWWPRSRTFTTSCPCPSWSL